MNNRSLAWTDMSAGVTRVSMRYFVRTAILIGDLFGGDVVLGLVFYTLAYANVAHIDEDPVQSRLHLGRKTPVPNEKRRPVTRYQLAKMLGMSYETLRRYVNKLEAQGYCRSGPDGVVVPVEVITAGPQTRAADRNRRNWADAIAALDRMGVLEHLLEDGDAPVRPRVARI